jgi:hypothetical protein
MGLASLQAKLVAAAVADDVSQLEKVSRKRTGFLPCVGPPVGLAGPMAMTGETLWHVAARSGSVHVLDFLATNGNLSDALVFAGAADDQQVSSLCLAVRFKKPDCLRVILRAAHDRAIKLVATARSTGPLEFRQSLLSFALRQIAGTSDANPAGVEELEAALAVVYQLREFIGRFDPVLAALVSPDDDAEPLVKALRGHAADFMTVSCAGKGRVISAIEWNRTVCTSVGLKLVEAERGGAWTVDEADGTLIACSLSPNNEFLEIVLALPRLVRQVSRAATVRSVATLLVCGSRSSLARVLGTEASPGLPCIAPAEDQGSVSLAEILEVIVTTHSIPSISKVNQGCLTLVSASVADVGTLASEAAPNFTSWVCLMDYAPPDRVMLLARDTIVRYPIPCLSAQFFEQIGVVGEAPVCFGDLVLHALLGQVLLPRTMQNMVLVRMFLAKRGHRQYVLDLLTLLKKSERTPGYSELLSTKDSRLQRPVEIAQHCLGSKNDLSEYLVEHTNLGFVDRAKRQLTKRKAIIDAAKMTIGYLQITATLLLFETLEWSPELPTGLRYFLEFFKNLIPVSSSWPAILQARAAALFAFIFLMCYYSAGSVRLYKRERIWRFPAAHVSAIVLASITNGDVRSLLKRYTPRDETSRNRAGGASLLKLALLPLRLYAKIGPVMVLVAPFLSLAVESYPFGAFIFSMGLFAALLTVVKSRGMEGFLEKCPEHELRQAMTETLKQAKTTWGPFTRRVCWLGSDLAAIPVVSAMFRVLDCTNGVPDWEGGLGGARCFVGTHLQDAMVFSVFSVLFAIAGVRLAKVNSNLDYVSFASAKGPQGRNEFPPQWDDEGEVVKGFFRHRARVGRWNYWYFLGHAMYDTADPFVRMLPGCSHAENEVVAGDVEAHDTRFAHDATLSRESRTGGEAKLDLDTLMTQTNVLNTWKSYPLWIFVFKVVLVATTTFLTSRPIVTLGVLAVSNIGLTVLAVAYPTYEYSALKTYEKALQFGNLCLSWCAFITSISSDDKAYAARISLSVTGGVILTCAGVLTLWQLRGWSGNPLRKFCAGGSAEAAAVQGTKDDTQVERSQYAPAPVQIPSPRADGLPRARSSSRSKSRKKAQAAKRAESQYAPAPHRPSEGEPLASPGNVGPTAIAARSPQISMRQMETTAPPRELSPTSDTDSNDVTLTQVNPSGVTNSERTSSWTPPPMTSIPRISRVSVPSVVASSDAQDVSVAPPSQHGSRVSSRSSALHERPFVGLPPPLAAAAPTSVANSSSRASAINERPFMAPPPPPLVGSGTPEPGSTPIPKMVSSSRGSGAWERPSAAPPPPPLAGTPIPVPYSSSRASEVCDDTFIAPAGQNVAVSPPPPIASTRVSAVQGRPSLAPPPPPTLANEPPPLQVLSRADAEALLAGQRPGTYLFRIGSRGDVILSVLSVEGVRNSVVAGDPVAGYTVKGDERVVGPFQTLEGLAESLPFLIKRVA